MMGPHPLCVVPAMILVRAFSCPFTDEETEAQEVKWLTENQRIVSWDSSLGLSGTIFLKWPFPLGCKAIETWGSQGPSLPWGVMGHPASSSVTQKAFFLDIHLGMCLQERKSWIFTSLRALGVYLPCYLILVNHGSLLLPDPEPGRYCFPVETTAPLGSGPNSGSSFLTRDWRKWEGGLDFDTGPGMRWSTLFVLISFVCF